METRPRGGHDSRVFFRSWKPLFCAGLLPAAAVLRAAEQAPEEPPAPHVLVYENGDRAQGRLVAREGDILVFRSLRFGELRVPASEARVITAPVAVRKALSAPSGPTGEGAIEEPGESPAGLARFFREVFGQWKGRLTVSSQVTNDDNEQSDYMAELKLSRKWTNDEVTAGSRYDFSQTDGNVTKDLWRANGMWRHLLAPSRYFTVYRPQMEWNRASSTDGVGTDYLLLQQEIGAGLTAIKTDGWNVRVGLAENFFDNWQTDQQTHHFVQTESAFLEADLKLPWRIVVTERAVWYVSVLRGSEGWEHQFEITKKFTDTLSLGLRQEVRRNDPDVRSEDYSLMRLLVGFDF